MRETKNHICFHINSFTYPSNYVAKIMQFQNYGRIHKIYEYGRKCINIYLEGHVIFRIEPFLYSSL